MPSASPRRELARLAIVVLTGIGSLGMLLTVGLLRARSLDGFQLDHSGWQVTATQVAAGVLGATVLLGCSLWFQRSYGSVASLTGHARAAILAALLPGLALAVGSGLGVLAAARYASDHTAAAAADRATAAEQRAQYRLSPTFRSHVGTPATVLAPLMLRAADLGAGWYDVETPNPRQLAAGHALDQAGGSYQKAHWTGSAWQSELMLRETVATLPTPAQARAYATEQSVTSASVGPTLIRVTRSVSGVPVVVTYSSRAGATFVIGTHAVTLRLITWAHPAPGVSVGTKADPAVLDALIRTAVLRFQRT